jgi:hypothetical protein
MKKVAATQPKTPLGEAKGSKNKLKILKTDTEGD